MSYPKFTAIALLYCLFFAFKGYSQIDSIYLSASDNSRTLTELIISIEKQNPGTRFYYKKVWSDSVKIDGNYSNKKLSEVLTDVLSKNKFYYTVDAQNNIYISRIEFNTVLERYNINSYNVTKQDNNPEGTDNGKNHISLLTEKVTVGKKNGSQKKYATVIGVLKDAETGEPLLGASVFVEELKTGAVADVNGNYMLSIGKGNYTFIFRSVGKETVQKKVNVLSDGRLNMDLKKSMIALDEVVVKEDKYNNIKGLQMGFEQITMKEIKELPPIAGERDILKASLLLPGVQTVGESSAGFNIRGGAADQNLFLINHVPIFNTSHMFGFFSAFNSEVVRNFNLFKSNIPVEYGGRISSVFDIRTKNGNEKKFSLKGGISPVTGNLSVEGPIVKNKSSYVLGVRSTYSNWILERIENPDIRNSNIYFYDFVANINTNINENNNIGVFGYHSRDNFRLPNDVAYNYYNLGGSVNWQHFFGKKLYSNLSFIYSNYHLKVTDKEIKSNAHIFNHDLKHFEINQQFNYTPLPNHEIKFGYNGILHSISPGIYEPENENSEHSPLKLEEESAIESAIYIGDKFDVGPNLGVEGGLRYSFYDFLGPKTVRNYLPGERPSYTSAVDTSYFTDLESIKQYSGLDIRLSARYLFDFENSIKLGYNRITQYLFMLTNTISISPTDRWKLCDNYTSPIIGQQYNIGYYRNFSQKNLEASVEVYYKTSENVKEFKNGADPNRNEFLERDLISGVGKTYGVEFMLKKTHGKVNGWINYTYSRSMVKFDGNTQEEIINRGEFYPANMDKPHNINFTANIKANRRLSLSTNFTYSTGRPTTYPVSKSYIGDFPVINYSDRNQERLPDYVRMDVAINLEGNLLRKKAAHSYWTLSVYNLLGRKNAYSVYFKNKNGKIDGRKISVFANPVITLTYNFKLGNYSSN